MSARHEEKRERFRRVAKRRTDRAVKSMQQLVNCANRTTYAYSDEEVDAMLGLLKATCDEVVEAFRTPEKTMQRTLEWPKDDVPLRIDGLEVEG